MESCLCCIPETVFKDQSLFKRLTVVALSVTISVCADNLPICSNICRKKETAALWIRGIRKVSKQPKNNCIDGEKLSECCSLNSQKACSGTTTGIIPTYLHVLQWKPLNRAPSEIAKPALINDCSLIR